MAFQPFALEWGVAATYFNFSFLSEPRLVVRLFSIREQGA